MINVNVSFNPEINDTDLNNVKDYYRKTGSFENTSEFSDKYYVVTDAILSWATELGWDMDAVVREVREALLDCLYYDEHNKFFPEIVKDAASYIENCLHTKDAE